MTAAPGARLHAAFPPTFTPGASVIVGMEGDWLLDVRAVYLRALRSAGLYTSRPADVSGSETTKFELVIKTAITKRNSSSKSMVKY